MKTKYNKKAEELIEQFKSSGWEMLEWTQVAMLMISRDRNRVITIKKSGIMHVGRAWFDEKVLGVERLDVQAPISRF